MKKIAIALAILMLVGCAVNSGVVKLGTNLYMVSHRGATGWSPIEALKTDAITEAGACCVQQKKTLEVVDTQQSHPPYLLGSFPRVDLQFKCIRQTKVDKSRTLMAIDRLRC